MPSSVQRRNLLALCVAAAALSVSAAALAAPPAITTFNAPGAGHNGATNQGTVGVDINDVGVIAGLIRDGNDVRHGYLREPDGRFTVFDHPDAGNGPGQGTRVGGLNALGAVAGTYRDANDIDRPYLRNPDGTFAGINLPSGFGGNGDAVNLTGTLVGNLVILVDPTAVLPPFHGFLRSPDGIMTIFDPPGSVMTEIPSSRAINDFGAVTGDFWTCSPDFSACSVHGFVRMPDGSYRLIDVAGAGPDGFSGQGTFPQGISDLGEVSGSYVDANSISHGFVRSAGGAITTFDVPTTCTGSTPPADCAFEGTFPGGVNLVGTVTGSYFGEDGNPHGFWRAGNGAITTFDLKRPGYLTEPVSLNDFGQITGIAFDPTFATHGLLVIP